MGPIPAHLLPRKYTSIHDAVKATAYRDALPELKPGNTEIWYASAVRVAEASLEWIKEHPSSTDKVHWIPDRNHLAKTHTRVGAVSCTDPQKLFNIMSMQWSLGGEGNQMIFQRGIDHTNMALGDVIKMGDRMWIVVRGCHDLEMKEV